MDYGGGQYINNIISETLNKRIKMMTPTACCGRTCAAYLPTILPARNIIIWHKFPQLLVRLGLAIFQILIPVFGICLLPVSTVLPLIPCLSNYLKIPYAWVNIKNTGILNLKHIYGIQLFFKYLMIITVIPKIPPGLRYCLYQYMVVVIIIYSIISYVKTKTHYSYTTYLYIYNIYIYI